MHGSQRSRPCGGWHQRDVESGPGPNQTSLLMTSVHRLLRPWPSDCVAMRGRDSSASLRDSDPLGAAGSSSSSTAEPARPQGGGGVIQHGSVRLGVVARRQQVSVALVSVQIILPPALLRVELRKFDAQLNVNDCATYVHVHVCPMSYMSLPCTSFLSPLSRPLSSYVCTRM